MLLMTRQIVLGMLVEHVSANLSGGEGSAAGTRAKATPHRGLQHVSGSYVDANHDGTTNPCRYDRQDYCCDWSCTYCGPRDYCVNHSPLQAHSGVCNPDYDRGVCENYYVQTGVPIEGRPHSDERSTCQAEDMVVDWTGGFHAAGHANFDGYGGVHDATLTANAHVVVANPLNGCVGDEPGDGEASPTGLANAAAMPGKIALIRRGVCFFSTKVVNAQNAGAIGAIVYNDDRPGTVVMSGPDVGITIPSVFIEGTDGRALNAAVTADPSVVVDIHCDSVSRYGSDPGFGSDPCAGGGVQVGAGRLSFADGYSNSVSCRWTATCPSGTVPTVSFSTFNTERMFDFVSIFDGPSAGDTRIGRFSGSIPPADICATDSTMLIQLTTDDSVTRLDGPFDAEITCGEPCPPPSRPAGLCFGAGDSVKVRDSIDEPVYGWGAVDHTQCGRVIYITASGDVTVDFPRQSTWHALATELEPCGGGCPPETTPEPTARPTGDSDHGELDSETKTRLERYEGLLLAAFALIGVMVFAMCCMGRRLVNAPEAGQSTDIEAVVAQVAAPAPELPVVMATPVERRGSATQLISSAPSSVAQAVCAQPSINSRSPPEGVPTQRTRHLMCFEDGLRGVHEAFTPEIDFCQLTEWVAQLLGHHGGGDALYVICDAVCNIVCQPAEHKFRRLNAYILGKRIGGLREAVQCLSALGFRLHRARDGTEQVVLHDSCMLDSLEHALEIILLPRLTGCGRSVPAAWQARSGGPSATNQHAHPESETADVV